jgi:hypothetical protein
MALAAQHHASCACRGSPLCTTCRSLARSRAAASGPNSCSSVSRAPARATAVLRAPGLVGQDVAALQVLGVHQRAGALDHRLGQRCACAQLAVGHHSAVTSRAAQMPRSARNWPSISLKVTCRRMCSQRTVPLGSSARTSMARCAAALRIGGAPRWPPGSARGPRDGCGRRWPGAARPCRRRPVPAGAPVRPRCGCGRCGSRSRPSPGRRPGCPSRSFRRSASRCASACLRSVMSRAMPSTPTTLPPASRSGILRESQWRTCRRAAAPLLDARARSRWRAPRGRRPSGAAPAAWASGWISSVGAADHLLGGRPTAASVAGLANW